MEPNEHLLLVRNVVGKIRACGHFIHHRTGGRTGRRRILRILSDCPDMLQKDLQERLKIQSGSLSEVVIRLEADGLIQKFRSPSDGRQWALHLTDAGKAEAQRLNAEYDQQILKMMNRFPPEELETLYQQLDTMLAYWNEVDPFPKPCKPEAPPSTPAERK